MNNLGIDIKVTRRIKMGIKMIAMALMFRAEIKIRQAVPSWKI